MSDPINKMKRQVQKIWIKAATVGRPTDDIECKRMAGHRAGQKPRRANISIAVRD